MTGYSSTTSRRLPATGALALALALLAACGPDNPTGMRPDQSPPSDAPLADAGIMDGSMIDATTGDAATGDGGMVGPKITNCATLPPVTSGTCAITAGSAALLLSGDVLTPGEVLHGGQVLIGSDGKIACVACYCSAMAAGATQITCPQGVISPGLINPHDHVTYAQNSPATDTGERYEQRDDWTSGLRGHTRLSYSSGANDDQIAWGELRFLMGGATSTVSAGGVAGWLRNLDKVALLEGLTSPPVDLSVFPLGPANQLAAGCGYAFTDTTSSVSGDTSYMPHISEGIDDVAHNEFLCTSSTDNGGQDLTQPQTGIIHAVSLTPRDYALMSAEGVKLVWSARTNVRTYGNTAEVPVAARLGALITLGTDWTVTGSMNLLRELKCADTWNHTYWGAPFTDEQLWLMVTQNAAITAAVEDTLGTLAVGKLGDVAIFDASQHPLHRAVIDAEAPDVVLVMRAGKALYGDADLVDALATGCDSLDVCGRMKALCAMSEIQKTYPALVSAVGSIYPAFFCGPPTNEPTCVPSRTASVNGSTVYTGVASTGDQDGDGVMDASDNCPSVFNPVRPMDDGRQGDFDGDGIGDLCDPCPTHAGTTGCPMVDPNDLDGDGVMDSIDDCTSTYNPDQKDSDSDGKGDACDACPMVPNPGPLACPATIYDIKKGNVAPGSLVSVPTGAIVTGVIKNGYYMQLATSDATMGPAYSGVFVFTSVAPTVAVGDHVIVNSATVTNFKGEIELTMPSTVVDTHGNAAPAPATTTIGGATFTAADLATGGGSAAAFEGVLVTVGPVNVTDIMPPPGTGDMQPTNEYVVDNALRVDDLFYLTAPFPLVGDNFASVTGVLVLRNGNSKVEPRAATDLVAGPPRLIGFGPTPTFTRVDTMAAPTIPTALTVTLTHAPTSDDVVMLQSSDTGSLTVPASVTVPAGSTSVVVPVSGVARSLDVTLTATLGSDSLTAHVRVLDSSDAPALASLTPAMTTVPPLGSADFTAALDLPAPAGGITVTLMSTSGTLPSTVVIPQDQVSAKFTYTATMGEQMDTIQASYNGVTYSSTIAVVSHVLLNEVDYDQPSTDTMEFVEIYNPATVAVDVSQIALVLFNGSTSPASEYARVLLTGSIPAQGFLVVGTPGMTVPQGVPFIAFAATSNNIQNGDPDGMALIDTSNNQVVDVLCYGGAITAAQPKNFTGTISLVEGTATTAKDSGTVPGSLIRYPDGTDTGSQATDWKFTGNVTPGAPNMP